MKNIILHNKLSVGTEEIAAIERVIKSGWVAQGWQVKKFEDEFSNLLFNGKSRAVAVSNGTSALYLALISLGVGPGDEVILPTYTCSAVLNAVVMTGATPVLVDIDNKTLNISLVETVKKITKKTKAIIITHTFGCPADLDGFLKLRVPIIEDCAQALGSRYRNGYLGTFGVISTFSFYASKVITTGNGGMIFSRNRKLIDKIRDYREFDCRKKYLPRFNFKMSDIQAAMGRIQLKKLPFFLKRRKYFASVYSQILPSLSVWPQPVCVDSLNFYRFLIRTKRARQLKRYFADNGIETIIPIESYELLHRYLGQDPKKFPVSEEVAKSTLSLPVYPALSTAELKYIVSMLNKYLEKISDKSL